MPYKIQIRDAQDAPWRDCPEPDPLPELLPHLAQHARLGPENINQVCRIIPSAGEDLTGEVVPPTLPITPILRSLLDQGYTLANQAGECVILPIDQVAQNLRPVSRETKPRDVGSEDVTITREQLTQEA